MLIKYCMLQIPYLTMHPLDLMVSIQSSCINGKNE